MVRIGRYRNESGPGLAIATANHQMVSGTINESSVQAQMNTIGAWLGTSSGSPLVRLVVYSDSGGSPGDPLAYSEEFAPTTTYTGGSSGAMHTAVLVNPFVSSPGTRYWVGVTARNGSVAIAMIPAADISDPDERFYRKEIDGNMPVNGSGSDLETAGHIMIYAEGEPVKPLAPDQMTPSGTSTGSNSPLLSMRHRDPNGRSAIKARVEVRRVVGGAVTLFREWDVNVTHNGAVNRIYDGTALLYGQEYQWRGATHNGVDWGPDSDWVSFTINPETLPKPDQLSPSGNVTGSNVPTFTFRHKSANQSRANRATVQVRPVGGTGGLLMNASWQLSPTISNNGMVSRVYTPITSAVLFYYTQYEWRARTETADGPGEFSDWTQFTIEHNNRPPYPPTMLEPMPKEFQKPSDITVFRMLFRDQDAALPGLGTWERGTAARVVIKNITANTDAWDSGWKTMSVFHDSPMAVPYTGPTLNYGILYQFNYQVRDRSGAESNISFQRVTFEAGGTVEKPTSPSGRVTSAANPGNVIAKYVNSDGVAASHMQVRLVNEQGNQVAYTDMIDDTVANGVTWARTWAFLSSRWIGNPSLSPGQTYGIEVRARVNVWPFPITLWSPTSWITINAAPSVPTMLEPINGAAFNEKPVLAVTVTDPDQPPTQLIVTFQIATDPQFTNILATTNGERVSGGTQPGTPGRFEKDLSGMALTIENTFYWRAYAYDGFIYSGETLSAASSAAASSARHFVYAVVPSVTITSPSVVGTSQPTFTWTTPDDQTRYQVTLTDADGNIAYDSGEVFSTDMSHPATTEGWTDGRQWQNFEELYLTVRVFDEIWGSSEQFPVTLEYVYPDSLTSVTAEAITPPGHVGTTVIRLGHDPTEYNEGDVASYNYYRTEIGGPGGISTAMQRVLMKRNTNIAEPWMEDWFVKSGQWYRYEASQVYQSGVDEIESPVMVAEAMAEWSGTVLHLPYQPQMYNIQLRFDPVGVRGGQTVTKSQAQNLIESPGMRKRVAAMGRRQDVDARNEFGLIRDPEAQLTGAELRDRLDRLMDCAAGVDSPDGLAHAVCWREGRGGRHGVIKGVFTSDSQITTNRRHDDVWSASLALAEIEFVEGEDEEAMF